MNDRKVSRPGAAPWALGAKDHTWVTGFTDVSQVFSLLLICFQPLFHSSLSPGTWKCEGHFWWWTWTVDRVVPVVRTWGSGDANHPEIHPTFHMKVASPPLRTGEL